LVARNNQAVENKIRKKEKQELRQIAGYKANAQNKKLQKELKVLEEASLEDVLI
jgi:hypothetical protein